MSRDHSWVTKQVHREAEAEPVESKLVATSDHLARKTAIRKKLPQRPDKEYFYTKSFFENSRVLDLHRRGFLIADQ